MAQITSKDVARLAAVSRTMVSLVLNKVSTVKIAAETRERVLKAAEELNYRPNMLAQSLKTNRSKIIALLIPALANPFFAAVAQGVEAFAMENGYNVFMCNTFRDPVKEASYIRTLLGKQVEGIIVAASLENPLVLIEARQRKIPLVTFEGRSEDNEFDSIRFDNIKGSEMAVNHLISLGHRHNCWNSVRK
jgi:LacI family transcriptional regulator